MLGGAGPFYCRQLGGLRCQPFSTKCNGTRQFRLGQVCAGEIGSREFRSHKFCVAKISEGQVGMAKICT